MDQDYHRYLNAYVRWGSAYCNVMCWLALGAITAGISKKFVPSLCANPFPAEFSRLLQNHDFLGVSYSIACEKQFAVQIGLAVWIAYTLLRLPFLRYQTGPLLKLFRLQLVRTDGKKWGFKYALTYSVLEWLPLLLASILFVFFIHSPNIFYLSIFSVIALGGQLVWSAPIVFLWKGHNLLEWVSGVTISPTDKKIEKIEKRYDQKVYRSLNKFRFGPDSTIYIFFISIFVFSFIQILRIPSENPAYQKIIYEGQQAVWRDNTYFALAGVFAPEDTTDFYQYGLSKSYEKFKFYELMKQRIGVRPEFWLDIPILKNAALPVDEKRELRIGDTRKLTCLFYLKPERTNECGTFADFEKFIADHKIIWERYNRVPDIGTVYVTPPQTLGNDTLDIIDLARLKDIHIIYLAKNGNPDRAMVEWLRYMKLYRAMARDRELLPFKAAVAVNIGLHLAALEYLLSIAPTLGSRPNEYGFTGG